MYEYYRDLRVLGVLKEKLVTLDCRDPLELPDPRVKLVMWEQLDPQVHQDPRAHQDLRDLQEVPVSQEIPDLRVGWDQKVTQVRPVPQVHQECQVLM